MIELKKSFLFLFNLKVFIIGLVWILFDRVILNRAINLMFPASALNVETLFLTFSATSILPEVIKLFIQPLVVSIILLFALNYWRNKRSDINAVYKSSKPYYKKLLFFYGIFFVFYLTGSLYALAFSLNMIQFVIPFLLYSVVEYVLSFILLFTPYVIVTTKISFQESLKKSFSFVKTNLKYTFLVYLITLFTSFLALSPAIVVANLTLYTGHTITLPVWTEVPILIMFVISFLFNISLVMGYYLKISKA